MDFENLSAKYKFLVIPISGTNTGTMIFDSLQRTDVYESIAVTDVYEFSYAAHISDSFHVLPFASSNDFMETLIKLVKDEEIEVIIPGSDWELKRIAHDRILFESLGVFLLINSDQVLDTCFDKKKTADFLKKNDLPYPKTIYLPRLSETTSEEIIENICLDYPFIIKPNNITGGSTFIIVVQDKSDFQAFFRENLHRDIEFLAQEYIDAPDQEYTVGVMSDKNGEIISSFALKRDLLTSASMKINIKKKYASEKSSNIVISRGLSQGYVEPFDEVRQFSENVAMKLESTGPINIQCRVTDKGIFIFEINPRFSGTTSIRAEMGHNDVELIFHSIVNDYNMGQQPYKFGSVVRGQKILYKGF